MGFDFSILPGGGGETGIVVTSLDLVIETAQCLGAEVIDVIACYKAIVDIFTLLFDLFFGDIFAGRPKVGKDSASDDTALFFIASSNPVIKMWGMGIRALEAKGIPTSVSGGWGLTTSIALAESVLNDLRHQFDGPTAPRLFYHSEFGTFPVTGLNLFTWYHQLGFRAHNPDSNALAIAIRVQIDTFYTILVRDGYIDPQTGFPLHPGPPPPPPPPKPTPSPKIPPPPAAPPANYDNAELCCWYEEQYAYHLAAGVDQITTLLQQQGASHECCDAVVVALNQLFTGLADVVASIGAGAAAVAEASDKTALVDAIGATAHGLEGALQQLFNMLGSTNQVLTRIAAAEEKEKPIDLKPVVDQLTKIVDQGDVKQSVLDYLVKQGFMSGADAQVISGASWADAIVGVFRTWGWNAILWVGSWVGAEWDGKKFVLKPIRETLLEDLTRSIDDALHYGSEPMYPIIKRLIDAVVTQLNPAHAVHIGDAGVDPDLLLTKTLVPALIVNGMALIADYLGWDTGEQWAEYVNLVTEFTGLAEIAEIQVGQRMRYGPMRVAEMHAKQLYRQEIPGSSVLYSLATRALITEARAAAINGYNGVPDELHGPLQTAAYQGLNPRQLLRLSATGLFDEHDLADEMTFAGLRAASQHRMLIAAPYLATDPERKQLRAAYEKAYVEGFSTDAQLTQQLDDAEHNTSRTFLILDRVRLEKRMALAKELETEYSTLYLGNQINLDTYHANLVGLGLQDDRVRALTARNEARAAVTLARQEAAAARALARATAAEERKAALRNYIQGNLNAITLAAALELTGLTHAQTAAWVDMAALQLAGAPRYKFGLRLTPDRAQLLTDRVRALSDQRKRQLITDLQYRDQLKALDIPPVYINALRAAADATLTPAKSALVLPVETS